VATVVVAAWVAACSLRDTCRCGGEDICCAG
jgi:hypothetical protein